MYVQSILVIRRFLFASFPTRQNFLWPSNHYGAFDVILGQTQNEKKKWSRSRSMFPARSNKATLYLLVSAFVLYNQVSFTWSI